MYDVATDKPRRSSDDRGARRSGRPQRVSRNHDELAQLVHDAVADKIAAKADRLAERAAAKAERLAAQAARHGTGLDKLSPLARDALDLWTRQRPGARRPRYTLDDIARAAMHIADTEGIDALSMRRLAIELGAGTMTLYHYVRTKDELLALVNDTVIAETLVPDGEFPSNWREAVSTIARRSRDAMLRHPWVFDIADEPGVGPNGVRHFDQSLRAVASLPISLTARCDVIFAVDEYVFGHCWTVRSGIIDDQTIRPELVEYVLDLARTGDYPHVLQLIDEVGADKVWGVIADVQRDSTRFERNLTRLLNGFEGDLPPT